MMWLPVASTLPPPGDFGSVGWVVVIVTALVVSVRQAVGLWRELSRPNGSDAMRDADDRFQPRGEYARQVELNELRAAILNTVKQSDLIAIAEELKADRNASQASRARMYQHIDNVEQRLGVKIDAFQKDFGQELGKMKQDMPMQIVTLLKNTGALK